MSSPSGQAASTAAELVVTTKPSDDAGAITADDYDWQASMAAADGLALYFRALDADGLLAADDDSRILCEYHEDWVVMHGSDAELVSGKHKEPSYGAYTTVYQLATDGGLAHLFIRWHAMEEKPTCRLVTTAGLSRGEAQDLAATVLHLGTKRLAGELLACSDDYLMSVVRFARALLRNPKGLPAIWQTSGVRGQSPSDEQSAQVIRFLAMLTIEESRPSRAFVSHAAPSMYCKPILERMSLSSFPPEALWEAIVSLFRARMRAAGPRPEGALPPVLTYRPGTQLPGPGEMERGLAARIVALADLDVALRTALAHPGGYIPLAPFPHTSRMAIKMVTGQCIDNSIERAEHLRLDYRRYWRDRTSGDITARATQDRLRRALLKVSDHATASVTSEVADGDGWGPRLWDELQTRVNTIPAGDRPSDMDAELLLGGICELCNLCRVWFSNRFDVVAELNRLRISLGVTST
jgi:hypothetical protein